MPCENVCRDCGEVVNNSYGVADVPVMQAEFRCSGSERSLGQCKYIVDPPSFSRLRPGCTQYGSQVAVSCQCDQSGGGSQINPHLAQNNYNTDSDSSSNGKTLLCCFLNHLKDQTFLITSEVVRITGTY